jgi:hypothetical protein
MTYIPSSSKQHTNPINAELKFLFELANKLKEPSVKRLKICLRSSAFIILELLPSGDIKYFLNSYPDFIARVETTRAACPRPAFIS